MATFIVQNLYNDSGVKISSNAPYNNLQPPPDGSPATYRATPVYPPVTKNARRILDSMPPGGGHMAFTWWNGQLAETFGPPYPSDSYQSIEYRVRYAEGGSTDPDILALGALQFNQITIPGSAPLAMGGPGTATSGGLDIPLARAMGRSLYDALTSLNVLNNLTMSAADKFLLGSHLAGARDQFANAIGRALQDYFGGLPVSPPAPPPAAPPGGPVWTLYCAADIAAPPASGSNDPVTPGQPIQKDGGADEEFLPLISSTLNTMSSQLANITEILNDIRGDDPAHDDKRIGMLELLSKAFDVLGVLKGAGDLAGEGLRAAIAAAQAIEAGAEATAAIAGLVDDLSDAIDSLGGGGGEILDDRADGMADLFMFRAKSIPEYLSIINETLLSFSEKIITKDSLQSVLDGYFMDSEHGGREGVKSFGGGSGDVLVVGYGQNHDEDLDLP